MEVISPSDRYTEVEDRVADWLAAGTHMVVVVNPRNRSMKVYHPPVHIVTLTDEDTLDGGSVVPGWQMPVRETFD